VISIEDLTPDDEMQLVYEAYPTTAELVAKIMYVTDITPDIFKGANLYTNEATGEGILQANDIPPFAKDINRFKESIFFANTRTKQRYSLSLFGVSDLIDDYNTLILSGNLPSIVIANTNGVSHIYSFVLGVKEITPITTVADIANSLNGKYFRISTPSDGYYVWYKTSGGVETDPSGANPGRTGIKVLINTGDTATTVATKTRDTLVNYPELFTATSLTSTITITNVDAGYTDSATAGTSGFTIGSITLGKGEAATAESNELTFPAGSVFNIVGAGNYFTINTAFNQEQYYVWYKVGASTDPSIANRTGLQVTILAADTAAQVAQKTKDALDALTNNFVTSINSNILTVTNYYYGQADDTLIGTMPVGFSINKLQEGRLFVLLSNEISPAISVDETARSLLHIININPHELVYGYYTSSTTAVPGSFLLEARTLSSDVFYIQGSDAIVGSSFSPNIEPEFTNATVSVGSPTTIIITTTSPHGLLQNDQVLLSGSTAVPNYNLNGVYTITYISSTQFRVPVTITTGGTVSVTKISRSI